MFSSNLMLLGAEEEFLNVYSRLLKEGNTDKPCIENTLLQVIPTQHASDFSSDDYLLNLGFMPKSFNVINFTPTLDDTTNFASNLLLSSSVSLLSIRKAPLNLFSFDIIGAVKVAEPTTAEPTTAEPTTAEPTTAEPTTAEPTTAEPTTAETTTAEPINVTVNIL